MHSYILRCLHISTVYRVNTRVNIHIPADRVERGSVLRFLVQGDGSRGQDRNVVTARDHHLGRVTPDIPGAGIRVWQVEVQISQSDVYIHTYIQYTLV